MPVHTLAKPREARDPRAPLHLSMMFDGDALVLGAGTRLGFARPSLFLREGDREAFDKARVSALLAVTYGRAITASELVYIRKALEREAEGQTPLALVHLALAGLPKLEFDGEAAWRLSAADGLIKGGMAPATMLEALGLGPGANEPLGRAYNPDQPRVPAGNGTVSGQWTSGDYQHGSEGAGRRDRNGSDSASPAPGVQVADNSPDWPKYLGPDQVAEETGAGAAGKDPATQNQGTPVVLPNGQHVLTTGDIPFLMSPTADLGPVAAAGRQVGETFREMLDDPDSSAGAVVYLYTSLAMHLAQGGIFDYQRQGNVISEFIHLPQFRNVSNFNVGLFCQQAGLTQDETLNIAGLYARIFSNNARPASPYGLELTDLAIYHAWLRGRRERSVRYRLATLVGGPVVFAPRPTIGKVLRRVALVGLPIGAIYLFLAFIDLAPNPYTCVTNDLKTIADLSGYRLSVKETDCDAIAKTDSIRVFIAKAGQGGGELIFQYGPILNATPPEFHVNARGDIVIAVSEIADIWVQRSRWRDVSIEYQIGRVQYPSSTN